MTDGERFSHAGIADCHQIRVTEGGRSHLDKYLVRSWFWNRQYVDDGLILFGVPLGCLHHHSGRTHLGMPDVLDWRKLHLMKK